MSDVEEGKLSIGWGTPTAKNGATAEYSLHSLVLL